MKFTYFIVSEYPRQDLEAAAELYGKMSLSQDGSGKEALSISRDTILRSPFSLCFLIQNVTFLFLVNVVHLVKYVSESLTLPHVLVLCPSPLGKINPASINVYTHDLQEACQPRIPACSAQ